MAAEIFGCTFRQQRGIIRLEQSPVLRRFDLVVPVPASGRERGYNLPDLLARQLAWALDTPLDCGALQKIRCTEKQEGKTARQRMENVKNAYRATNPAAGPPCPTAPRRCAPPVRWTFLRSHWQRHNLRDRIALCR